MRIVDLTARLDLSEVDALLELDDIAQNVDKAVREILDAVQERGDQALCELSKRFDAFDLTPELMRVPEEEIHSYASGADDELVDILRHAAKNIREFHEQQTGQSLEFYA